MPSRSHFYRSADGLLLHVRIHGDLSSGAAPVVCLPGLTRNARDFDGLAAFLTEHPSSPRPVAAFDYRGRGLSDHDPDWRNYNIGVEAGDVLAGLASLGVERAAFVGTSRGGLILHLLASARPDLLAAAVLNDVGPELGLEGLAQIRGYLTSRAQPESWTEAIAAQKAIHGAAFPALTDSDWERLANALYRDLDGRPVLDFDPSLVRPLADLDLSKPPPDLWPQFDALASVPLLVIRGEHSRLLTEETVARMHEQHAALQSLTVPGQGHAPLLETSDIPAQIAAFLKRSK